MESRFNIDKVTLERALENMIKGGYMNEGDTTEDLESMAYSCCEGLAWYAKSKIYEWAEV